MNDLNIVVTTPGAPTLLVEQDANGCWFPLIAVRDGGTVRKATNAHGYVDINLPGRKNLRAHRVTYEAMIGPIPKGLTIDHLCRVRACCNPEHLEPVTWKENILRGAGTGAANAVKTHCVNGHEFTPENTYPRPGGGRACRTCGRNNMRRYKSRR